MTLASCLSNPYQTFHSLSYVIQMLYCDYGMDNGLFPASVEVYASNFTFYGSDANGKITPDNRNSEKWMCFSQSVLCNNVAKEKKINFDVKETRKRQSIKKETVGRTCTVV